VSAKVSARDNSKCQKALLRLALDGA